MHLTTRTCFLYVFWQNRTIMTTAENTTYLLQRSAIYLGSMLMIIGLIGCIPGLGNQGYLAGIFEAGYVQHIIHLLVGMGAWVMGLVSDQSTRGYYRAVGIGLMLPLLVALFLGAVVSVPAIVLYASLLAFFLYGGFSGDLMEEKRLPHLLDATTDLV